jgi:hypothetical protein
MILAKMLWALGSDIKADGIKGSRNRQVNAMQLGFQSLPELMVGI